MRKPNVILINCDDLGYGDLGCYGSTRNQTPAIDSLADAGIRFTDFYMASPVCSPSRGAMLTGCYPPRINFDTFGEEQRWVLFPGMAEGLSPDEYTIANLFKDCGYKTKMVGKWHCGDQKEFSPVNYGFDSYYGLPYSNDMGRQVNRHEFPPLPLMRNAEVIQEQPDQTSLTERYTEEAVSFIRDAYENDEQYFLYFAHMYVHQPIYVPDSFLRRSRNGRYGAAVECIDWSLSVILKELKERNVLDDTLIIFTSDNGSRTSGEGGSNGILRGIKGQSWEGGMRVPFIASWPAVIEKGLESDKLVSSIDLLPTFAALLDQPLPSERKIDGIDQSNLLLNPDSESNRKTFFYYKMDRLEAVRFNEWKLHISKDMESERSLYDLSKDPGETHNVYDDFPKIAEKLHILAELCIEELGDAYTGVRGNARRPCGTVDTAEPLTFYDSDHPYIIAEYDLEGWG